MDLDTAVKPGLGLPKGYTTPPSKAEVRRIAQGISPGYSPAYPVNIPTKDAKDIAYKASAIDRDPTKKGGKSRRRKSKKARKTKTRKVRKSRK